MARLPQPARLATLALHAFIHLRMRVLSTLADLKRASTAGCLLVPTMGALHEGHFSLIQSAAAERASRSLPGPIIATIFVNPTQFNDPKDLDRYPRTLENDVAGCTRAGADFVFAPTPEVVYPSNHPIPVPPLPLVATQPGLEDALRPGHFAGVCQVVQRLFDLTAPRVAFFGEKDWQQLAVIQAMVLEARLPIDIRPVRTRREPDGLAMSSRNVFLKPAERLQAVALVKALRAASDHQTVQSAELSMRAILTEHGLGIEYAVVRQADTLLPLTSPESSKSASSTSQRPVARSLIAARLGTVRLIDNAPWPWHE